MSDKRNKNQARLRRARKTRAMLKGKMDRLCVHKTSQHTYAQLIDKHGKTLTTISTLDKGLRSSLSHGANMDAAKQVGTLIGEKAKQLGISDVAFDRSGNKYHGRVKALADAAREAGLQF